MLLLNTHEHQISPENEGETSLLYMPKRDASFGLPAYICMSFLVICKLHRYISNKQ